MSWKKNFILPLFLITFIFGFLGVVSSQSPVEDAIIAGADRLVATQNDDGGWDWPGPDGDLTDPSPENTFGVIAQGLLTVYELTGNQVYLDAAEKAGDHLVTLFETEITTNRINAFDIVFLYDLGKVSDVEYTNMANTLLVGTLTLNNYWASHYGNFCDVSGCTAQDMFDAISNRRGSTNSGLILWDLAPWVKAANLGEKTVWADALKILMDDEYATNLVNLENSDYYVIGLSGVVSATGNTEAVEDLIEVQVSDGSWTYVQDTAYAVMALVNAEEMTSATWAVNWLVDNQSESGAWIGSNGVENSEVGSEAVQALFDFGDVEGPSITDVYIEPSYPNLLSTLVKIYATITDEGSGVDYATLYYQVEGDPTIHSDPFTAPVSGGYAGIVNGNPQDGVLVKYYIEAKDNVGNTAWYPSQSTWKEYTYDGSAPTTTKEYGTPFYNDETDDYITSDTIIILTCTDTINECNEIYYKIDEEEWQIYSVPFNVEGDDEPYTIYYYSIDNAGNQESEKSQEVILDNTKPEVTLTGLEEYYNSIPIILEFTYSDLGSGISEYKVYKKRLGVDLDFIDITTSISCIGMGTTTCEFEDGTKDGKFEFKVEVIDNVENSRDSNIISTTLDRAGPDAVNLDTPQNGVYVNYQPLLSWFEGEDNDDNLNPAEGPYGISGIKEYELELDAGESIKLNELNYQTSELSEGAHTWRVRANDNAGNIGGWSEIRTFNIDITPPEISSVDVTPKYDGSIYVAGIITASADVTDTNEIVSVEFNIGGQGCIDAESSDGWACNIDTTSLEDGEYSLIVTATDVAENVKTDNSLIIIVDNTEPTTIIVSPEEGSLFAFNFDISVGDSDESSGLYECKYRVLSNDIETKSWTLRICSDIVTLTVGGGMDCNVEGENVCKLEVKAIDNLGNENIVVERTFSIDWSNPPQVLDSGPSGTIVNSWTELFVETNKPATCRYDTVFKSSYDAMSYEMTTTGGTISSQLIEGLTDKSYAYYILCKDNAGNEMTTPVQILFDVDTREGFSVTIPQTKGDYLQQGWNQFFLPSFVLENTTLESPFELEEVLESIEGNYAMVYHFDGTVWMSYVPGRDVNDLLEFNGGGFPYFIYMDVSGERIEIE